MEQLRKTLDQLMGADRDLPLKERLANKKNFDSSEVCKFFLIGFCPHDLFANTKNDLKECRKRHDVQFKEQFNKSPDKEMYQIKYEELLMEFLQKLVNDVDEKMRKSLERIEAPLPETELNPEVKKQIMEIDSNINSLNIRANELSKINEIEQVEELMKLVDELNAQKKEILSKYGQKSTYKEKQMKVCEICGAMQSSQDNEKRLLTHVEGKLHSGYLKIRKYLEALKKRKEERKKREKLLKEKKEYEKFIEKEGKTKKDEINFDKNNNNLNVPNNNFRNNNNNKEYLNNYNKIGNYYNNDNERKRLSRSRSYSNKDYNIYNREIKNDYKFPKYKEKKDREYPENYKEFRNKERDYRDREKDLREREFRDREFRERKSRENDNRDKEKELRERKLIERELRERELRERELRERELRERELRKREFRERELREREYRDREREYREREYRDRNNRDKEKQYRGDRDYRIRDNKKYKNINNYRY
jgi:hypothetical protein